jgi:hypothetical protein
LQRQVAAITTAPDDIAARPLRLPGDPFALRGLPMVGKECLGGEIPGTRPDKLYIDG